MRQWWARMRRRPQPGFNPEIWASAQIPAKEPFRGETVAEPYVRRQLQDLRGRLVRLRLGDGEQRGALGRLAAAEIRVAVATERSLAMEGRVRRALEDARQTDTSVEPGLTSAQSATRDVPLEQRRADEERLQAGEELQRANQAVDAAGVALFDRLMGSATAGLEPINEYIAAYNYACTYERKRGLAPLPDGLAEQLVREASAVGGNG